jgi:O-antigen/teichoic acid export membrane protein
MALRRSALNATQRATLGSILTGLVAQATLIVSGVLAARLLGVEDRGYFALLTILPIVLARLGGLGLPIAATFYIARDQRQARAVVNSLAGPAALQAAALVLIQIAAVVLLFEDEPHRVLLAGLLTVVTVPGLLAQQHGLAILQGQQRFRPFNLLRTLPAVLYSVGVAAMAAFDRDELPLITSIWVCAWAGVGLATLWIALRGLPSDEIGSPAPARSAMFSFGLRGLLGWASPVETLRVDQVVAGLFLSPAALGLYVVGLAFTNLPRFIATSIGMVAYPHVARTPDTVTARRAMWRFVGLTALLSVVLVAGLEALAGRLVPFFFGDEFKEAVSVTRILLIGALLVSVRRVLTDVARGAARPTAGSVAEVASWVVLAAALPVLVPAWGVEGVATAVVISSALSLALLMILVIAGAPDARTVADRPSGRPAPGPPDSLS